MSLTGVTKSCLWCHLDLCVGVSWAQDPGWRSSGGFRSVVHTPSPGYEQLLCNRFVPGGGLKIHWWGPKQIYSIASLPLSYGGALLIQFKPLCICHGPTEQLLGCFFFLLPPTQLKIFLFQVFWAESLICCFLSVMLGSLL